ncbi:ATP-dependent zinc protease [Pseudomonas sp.]|uniref:retropepsin-like aspartic peptidase RloA2 n=1 Tax=Pseudomonas sp. TaxID=306 RepID=UPI0028A69B46|nr:ATP-dependent zinc protease [Pseudomonas sp.]
MKAILALLALSVVLPAAADEQEQPTLYGRNEYVRLPELGKTLRAKLDTGALNASLSAKDIERFERDGEDWVRFRLAGKGADDTLYEHKLARIGKIKNRAGEQSADEEEDAGVEVSKRPVIDLELCMGEAKETVEVNLADRSNFIYPLLLGAKTLRELDAAVDPARRFTTRKPEC